MNRRFREALEASDFIRSPLPVDRNETAEARWERKKVLENRLLDGARSLEHWTTVGNYARMELSTEFSVDGAESIRFTSVTRLDHWEGAYSRIYTTPAVLRRFPGEDWTDWNRVSVWVRPEMPGFKFTSLHVQLVNEGKHAVPDKYEREGCHNMNLVNHEWNRVTFEIGNVYRDKVTGLRFGYDMVGNEREAEPLACFYIGRIELEKVEAPDTFKGWEPGEGILAFSGSGYQTGSRKTAVASKLDAARFRLVEAETGKVVLDKTIETLSTVNGTFRLLDFSEVVTPGLYLIVAGDVISRTFPIGDGVREESLWKAINFFFCERCGFEVPRKHKYCHGNVITTHGDRKVVSNGGWHDAGDMSQNLTNTAEAVYAFFEAASRLPEDAGLRKRLVEEGKWGLEWMLKTRFGDGYRAMQSGTSVWTGGIQGDSDEIVSGALNLAVENFMAAGAEALASRVLESIDPEQSAYLKKVAAEDWNFAYRDMRHEGYVALVDPARVSSPVLLYSAGTWAAVNIFRATGEGYFAEKAVELGSRILECQQRGYHGLRIPLTGFFYRDVDRELLQHYNHRSHEHEPILALSLLCETLPHHPDWIRWYHAVALHGEYLKAVNAFTAPWGMAPASIYHVGEADADPELFLKQQAYSNPGMLNEYRAQVENGIPLGDGYYFRRMPVWFSFRGNNAVVLSAGKAAALAARLRDDYELSELAQRQLEWVTGRNPFAQSLMYGEGYDYCGQYACLPGDMAGEVPVGIGSFENEDAPYWPHANNAVYREVWTHTTLRWLWLASEASGPARVEGLVDGNASEVVFAREGSGAAYRFVPDTRSGVFSAELPSGRYTVSAGGRSKRLTLVPGKRCELEFPLRDFLVTRTVNGGSVEVTIEVTGGGEERIELRADNIAFESVPESLKPGLPAVLRGSVTDGNRPWLAVILPGGRIADRIEIRP